MQKDFEKTKLDKIKINVENNNFWVVPDTFRLFTPKRSNFIIKKANSIEQIIKENRLDVGNYYFSFNKDHDFKFFNELQKHSFLSSLQITKNVQEEVEKKGYYIFDVDNVIKIKLNEKSLYKIFQGNSFLINENYFDNYVKVLKHNKNVRDIYVFIWTGSKFELE